MDKNRNNVFINEKKLSFKWCMNTNNIGHIITTFIGNVQREAMTTAAKNNNKKPYQVELFYILY